MNAQNRVKTLVLIDHRGSRQPAVTCARSGQDRQVRHGWVPTIEEHLDTGLTLEQMAAAAHLSAYHFARQFKAATGMPPHQYVIARRVERAQQLLQPDSDLSLAEIAAHAGFSDQSQFS